MKEILFYFAVAVIAMACPLLAIIILIIADK